MSIQQTAAETADAAEPEGSEFTTFRDEPWLPRLLTPETGLPTAGVAAGTGLLGWWLTSGAGTVLPLATGLLCAVLVVLAVIDVMTKRLPDAIVLPLYPVLVLAAAAAAAAGEIPWGTLGTALICMAGCYSVYWLICFITGGMGWGDAKLAGVLGLVLGLNGAWDAVYGALVLPMILGGLAGLPLVLSGKQNVEMPFGPFLVAGALPVLMMPGELVPFLMDLFR